MINEIEFAKSIFEVSTSKRFLNKTGTNRLVDGCLENLFYIYIFIE